MSAVIAVIENINGEGILAIKNKSDVLYLRTFDGDDGPFVAQDYANSMSHLTGLPVERYQQTIEMQRIDNGHNEAEQALLLSGCRA